MNLVDKIICLLCIVVPLFNFLNLLRPYGIRRVSLEILASVFTLSNILLLIAPIFIAVSILKKQNKSKFLLLTYLVFLVIYNIYLSIYNPTLQNISILVGSILTSLVFFLVFRYEIDAKNRISKIFKFLMYTGDK
ncbi:hypothetical protein EHQ46_05940 [Leptospira yanagawae]|uniref:Uncharacterized protein n=1 Tax=Leptospira yanagawae TaxID=293069 RepID=A0ABY2M3H3_9LEPT|nr:hypothetical protein [Leptospira yanagawae]TGL23056.1 hypothetical protein EHQ46_05940 [Leptospira yanagawae]